MNRINKSELLFGDLLSNITSSDIIGFAGSRSLDLSFDYCKQIIDSFSATGCRFAVGCAGGVDKSFLRVLSISDYKERAYFFRAFSSRSSFGLQVAFSSPSFASPRQALGMRTAQFVKNCSTIILFPADWGRGSSLCYKLAGERSIPVIVVP